MINVDSPEEKARIEALPYTLNAHITDLLDGFKWAVHKKNTSVVIIVDGRSGMGKTTLINQMGRYCDPDYNLHKVHYHPEKFLDGLDDKKVGLAQAKKGDFISFDEGMILSSRAAMTSINRMVMQAFSMIRSKNIIIAIAINSIFDIDRNLALSRADILFNCYGESLTDRGRVMAFFKGADGFDRLHALIMHGKKYYDYSFPKSNFNTTFSSNFVLDEVEYEKQKQEGVNEFLRSIGKEKPSDRATSSRDRMVVFLRKTRPDLTIKEIAELAGISEAWVYKILAKHKEELDRK